MPEPFDVTLQYLLESDPEAWLVLLGLPGKNVEVIDADLAALPVEPDRVLRVLSEDPFLLHLEFQSGYRQALLERILLYNVLLRSRHGLPTLSYLLLLRPEADGPEMVDVLRCTGPAGAVYWEFQYRILRLWQKPVSELLEGPLATLPFAPLADVAPEQLPDILLRMQARIQAEAQAGVAVELWTIAYILMGLRYAPEFIEQLLKGVEGMEDSATYQFILAKGEARGEMIGQAKGQLEEARRLLLRLGAKRLGALEAPAQAAIHAIATVEELEDLAERLLDVESWTELLAEH